MATKTRRNTTNSKRAEREAEKVKEESEESEEEDVDDDDAPPPVLEREPSCGENDDTDGDGKEEEESPPLKKQKQNKSHPQVVQIDDEDEEEEEGSGVSSQKQENLMEALSHVFSVVDDGSGKQDPFPKNTLGLRKGRSPVHPKQPLKTPAISSPVIRGGPIPKSQLLLHKSVRPATCSSPSTSTRFPNLRPVPGSSAAVRQYGYPPPRPNGQRQVGNSSGSTTPPTVGVGSNTAIGPARLLEGRKRELGAKKEAVLMKRPSLVAYNGGRAGENFRKAPVPCSSSASSSRGSGTSTASSLDVQTMLREQSPIKIQVSAGIDRDLHSDGDNGILDAIEFSNQQKETIGSINRAATSQNLLLGSLIINGLNSLQERRDTDDYYKFTADLFGLITKYRLT
ncbi:unnamed protein product [Caenorhabditis sp. 36 PRJEB53466]|nr:unnamed protein product [Caenorhabditis sp. 36 PRJEB53466]